MALPFEFVVPGPPVSQQARRKKRREEWKGFVRSTAENLWRPNLPEVVGPLRLEIVYYFRGDPLDTDNMVKPIQDALKSVVYTDDNLISDVIARRRPLDGSFRVRRMTPALAVGFAEAREFLHVVVDRPDPEELV